MPLEIGGLNLPPSVIGYVMGGYGAATGLFQFFCFAKVNRALGERRVFLTGMMTLPMMFALLPIISLVAKKGGVNMVVWGLLVVTMGLMVIMDMAYGEHRAFKRLILNPL